MLKSQSSELGDDAGYVCATTEQVIVHILYTLAV